MWNITSNNVQRAKEQLELRRAEIEARYAEENQALDAEASVIETLERAASEFMLRHREEDGASASTDRLGGSAADNNWASATEASAPVTLTDMPEYGETGNLDESPSQSAVETDPSAAGEMRGGLDFLKPGSRWRLYRNQPTDPEGVASDAHPHIG